MLINALIQAARPFVNIYFTAKLVTLLSNGADFKDVLIYICLALIINFIFHFLNNFLSDYESGLQHILLEKLENSEFREIIHKHEEAGASRWARFPYFIWTTSVFISGVLTLTIAIIMIMPLLKIGFTATGAGFFEKPVFLITLICVIVSMAVIMLLIAIKMNKSYLAANEAYAELDRLFYSFIDIFRDYKTGKEIRLYKEQELINHIATDKILNDGEKTLKKISMKTAKTSSFVAIMGAAGSFGVYLFIGVKGLYGLFDIGNLVLYCGAFMQIINGVMQLANTLGKLVEILPLANVYFTIIESTDDKRYGEKELNQDKIEIEFRNVSFRYPGSKNYALKNVNLHIKNGKHLAVVGRNGSGKSSLLKLVIGEQIEHTGLVQIASGLVISYVPQDTSHLYGTLSEFAEENKIDESLFKSVLSKLDFHQIQFGKNMQDFSGGQKKKVLIAKSLCEQAHLYVWDEPLNFIDVYSRIQIEQLINEFSPTMILVEHDSAFRDMIATKNVKL